jgi:chromosome segregation ATPase
MNHQVNDKSLASGNTPGIWGAQNSDYHAHHNAQAESTIRALQEEVEALKGGMDMMVADLFAEYDKARNSLEAECSEQAQQVLDLTAKLQEYQAHQTQKASTLARTADLKKTQADNPTQREAELADQYNMAVAAAQGYQQRSEQAELRVQELEKQVAVLLQREKQRIKEMGQMSARQHRLQAELDLKNSSSGEL